MKSEVVAAVEKVAHLRRKNLGRRQCRRERGGREKA
jgi:hypothetical protein